MLDRDNDFVMANGTLLIKAHYDGNIETERASAYVYFDDLKTLKALREVLSVSDRLLLSEVDGKLTLFPIVEESEESN